MHLFMLQSSFISLSSPSSSADGRSSKHQLGTSGIKTTLGMAAGIQVMLNVR